MPTLTIHTGLPRHGKFAILSDTAFRLWFHAACWCRDECTDGVIPMYVLCKLGVPHRAKHRAELCAIVAGQSSPLWYAEGDCYRFHDWLSWNDSKAEVQANRAHLRERLRRFREKRRAGNAVTPALPPEPVTPNVTRYKRGCNGDVTQGTTELPNSERSTKTLLVSSEPEPAAPASEPTPAVLTFPTVGAQRSWALTQSAVEEWRAAYPNRDVVGECRKALAWVKAVPTRRKTARGMPRFLLGWLNRAVDQGRNGGPPGTSASEADPRTLRVMQNCSRCLSYHYTDEACSLLPAQATVIQNVKAR